MISNTNSLIILKSQIQEVYDFAVLNCYAIPSLKTVIKKIESGDSNYFISRPDYFSNKNDTTQLKGMALNYKNSLSKFIILSSFSYFENYVISAINEIIEFYGGAEKLQCFVLNKFQKIINENDPSIIKSKRKLQEYPKKSKSLKYKKHIDILKEENYRFPSDLFSFYGIQKLCEDLGNIKSYQIPEFLTKALFFIFQEDEVSEYHNIRNIRNKIAHGDVIILDIKKVNNYNRFLRKLAVRIDKHIVTNFLIIEDI